MSRGLGDVYKRQGWFRDFQEVCAGSDAIARDARRVLSALNNSNENNKARGGNDDPRRTGVVKEFERGERQSGFERGTQVITRDGPRSIEDIEIGTQMPNGAAVLGTYRCDLRNAIGSRTPGGTWMPSDQIVATAASLSKDDGAQRWKWTKWYTVAKHNTVARHGNESCAGYHLVTTNGTFVIPDHTSNHILVRDFTEGGFGA